MKLFDVFLGRVRAAAAAAGPSRLYSIVARFEHCFGKIINETTFSLGEQPRI